MNPTEPASHSLLGAFLEQYRKDKTTGSVRPLQSYLDQFPGAAEEIASAYLRDKSASDPASFSLDNPR